MGVGCDARGSVMRAHAVQSHDRIIPVPPTRQVTALAAAVTSGDVSIVGMMLSAACVVLGGGGDSG